MAIAGKGGSVKIGANTANVSSWSLDISPDMIDTSKLGESWKGVIPGLLDATGSIEADYETTDTNGQTALQTALLNQTTVTLNLYVDATHYYSMSAYITGMNVEVPSDDKVTRSVDFQQTGGVTYT